MKGRAGYDFDYVPVATCASDDDGAGVELVVATSVAVDPDALARIVTAACSEATVRMTFWLGPIFWTQIQTGRPHRRAEIEDALLREGVPVRYVASARRQSQRLPTPLDCESAALLRPTDWAEAPPRAAPVDRPTDGRWFLRDQPGGLAVDREVCGTGRGTRLAVIDEDAADLDLVPLDATVLVGVDRATKASGHGALLTGWAVRATTHEGSVFSGVAPDASVRAYLIPRPGDDVVALPMAIARAAADGADVIACATYVEGAMSPMLDDALELATRVGRGGRGCVLVVPTGRETSSPPGSLHASLSLSLGDPASDPRVLCVGPGGRRGGWFLWKEQHGRLRPFANRGPAVRCLAPGDDMTYPFLATERLFHAESSGASALAAGVALLLVASNPLLRADEILTLIARSGTAPEPLSAEVLGMLADPSDVLPSQRDADGHDAKHGYGRMHALRACLSASDPVSFELVAIGEVAAARAWATARKTDPVVAGAYGPAFGWSAVRALLSDEALAHAVRVVLRHFRLLASDPRRADAQHPGAAARQIALLLRKLAGAAPMQSASLRAEVHASLARARDATRTVRPSEGASDDDAALVAIARTLFSPQVAVSSAPGERAERAGPPAIDIDPLQRAASPISGASR
jgi:hypothetical protein